MERTSSISQFEKAIKDFSKISIEVDSLINLGNADAVKTMNKSIENRKEAIAHEASRRLVSFEVDQKEKKTKESSNTHDTLEKLILQEVELEFDSSVKEEKLLLRGNSEEVKSVAGNMNEVDKEEDAESSGSGSENSTEEENTDENSGKGSTDEESTEEESTEEDSSEEESSAEESTDGTSDKDNSDGNSTKNVKDDVKQEKTAAK